MYVLGFDFICLFKKLYYFQCLLRFCVRESIYYKKHNKQANKKKQTNKLTNKKNNEANPEFKADAAVPQYHCQNFLYSVSNLEYNLMSFFYYFSVIIITSYVLTLLKFILLRENCIRCYSYFCLLPP